MRPTNRKFIRPSSRIFSSAGRRGASLDAGQVERDRHHAGGREAHLFELLAVEIGVAEGEIDVADERREVLAAERGQPEQIGVVAGEKMRRGDVVILQDARARKLGEGRRHRGRKREMEDRDIAPAGVRLGPRTHVPPQVVVHRHREQIGLMPATPQQVANPPRAVADRIAAMRGRHPLIDDHARESSAAVSSSCGAAGGSSEREPSSRMKTWGPTCGRKLRSRAWRSGDFGSVR